MTRTGRVLACALLLASALQPTSAFAQSAPSAHAPRGWLSGVGLALVAGSLAGLALGVDASLRAGASSVALAAIGTPTSEQAPAARQLIDRRDAALGLATPLYVASATALLAGVAALVVDGRGTPVLSLMPTVGGAAVVVSVRWP